MVRATGPLGGGEVGQRLFTVDGPRVLVSAEARSHSLQELGLSFVLCTLESTPEVARTFSPHF
jgi:hypothetical protein